MNCSLNYQFENKICHFQKFSYFSSIQRVSGHGVCIPKFIVNECILWEMTHSNIVTYGKIPNFEMSYNEYRKFQILNLKNTESRPKQKLATSRTLHPNWTPAVNRQPGFRRKDSQSSSITLTMIFFIFQSFYSFLVNFKNALRMSMEVLPLLQPFGRNPG